MKNIKKDKNLVKETDAELNEDMLDDVAGGFSIGGFGDILTSAGKVFSEGADVANELNDVVDAGKQTFDNIKNSFD